VEVRIERYNNGAPIPSFVEDRRIRRRCESEVPDMLSLDAHVLKVLNRRTWQALIE
jgi:hypothetical protein